MHQMKLFGKLLVTRDEVAEVLRTTPEVIDRMVDEGRLRAVRLLPDEPPLFRPEVVIEFLDSLDGGSTFGDGPLEYGRPAPVPRAFAPTAPVPPVPPVPPAPPAAPAPPAPPGPGFAPGPGFGPGRRERAALDELRDDLMSLREEMAQLAAERDQLLADRRAAADDE